MVGSLWFTCAQESCNTGQQLVAYQRAIQAIQQVNNELLTLINNPLLTLLLLTLYRQMRAVCL